jgi:hypothetical protein
MPYCVIDDTIVVAVGNGAMRVVSPRLNPVFVALSPGCANITCQCNHCAAKAGVNGTQNPLAAVPVPVANGNTTSGPTDSSQPGMPRPCSASGSGIPAQELREVPSNKTAGWFGGKWSICTTLE